MGEGELPKAIIDIYTQEKVNGFGGDEIHLVGDIYFPVSFVGGRNMYELGFPNPESPLAVYYRKSHGGDTKENKRHLVEIRDQGIVKTIESLLTPQHKQQIEELRLGILEMMEQSPQ